jgi:hypothetical protein
MFNEQTARRLWWFACFLYLGVMAWLRWVVREDVWDTCVLFPGFSRSACASWVQAWGSIAAIVAAIAIAATQHRNAEKAAAAQAKLRAEIAGTAVLFRLNPLKAFASHVIAQVRMSVDQARPFDGTVYAKLFDAQPYPSERDVLAIADHHQGCAAYLVRARNLLGQAQLGLSLTGVIREFDDAAKERLNPLIFLLQGACNQYERAMEELESFVPLHME